MDALTIITYNRAFDVIVQAGTKGLTTELIALNDILGLWPCLIIRPKK